MPRTLQRVTSELPTGLSPKLVNRRYSASSHAWTFHFWYSLQRPTEAGFTGKVMGVTDGDTIKVLHDGKAEKRFD